MKYYIRQVRPYIKSQATPGSLCVAYAVDGYGWVPEDMEEELRNKIVVEDNFDKLVFQERFVEERKE